MKVAESNLLSSRNTMDHAHHHHEMDHSTPDITAMPVDRCSMYMLWNTNIINTCVVFASWHIRSHFQFYLSFVAIVFLGIGYEWLRDAQKKLDRRIAARMLSKGRNLVAVGAISLPEDARSSGSANVTQNNKGASIVPVSDRIQRALLYGTTVFLSFFLMLVFMTYNAYLIVATVLGAAIGHFIFQAEMDPDLALSGQAGKGMTCH